MAPFIVHSVPGSPYGRSVLATLEEKGATYRLAALAPGAHKAAEHLRRHPFGKMPALQHGDFGLYETQAILRYLDRILPSPPLTPTTPQAAARMDQAMNVCDHYLFSGVGNVIGFQRVVGPRLMGLTPDEGVIAQVMAAARTVFAELARLLGDQAYFAGEAVSLADMMLAPQMDFLSQTPEWVELAGARANLRAWLDRMNARPSLAATTWERVAAMAA